MIDSITETKHVLFGLKHLADNMAKWKYVYGGNFYGNQDPQHLTPEDVLREMLEHLAAFKKDPYRINKESQFLSAFEDATKIGYRHVEGQLEVKDPRELVAIMKRSAFYSRFSTPEEMIFDFTGGEYDAKTGIISFSGRFGIEDELFLATFRDVLHGELSVMEERSFFGLDTDENRHRIFYNERYGVFSGELFFDLVGDDERFERPDRELKGMSWEELQDEIREIVRKKELEEEEKEEEEEEERFMIIE